MNERVTVLLRVFFDLKLIYKAALYYTVKEREIMIHTPTREEACPEHLTIDHSDLPIISSDDVISSISESNKEFLLDFLHSENLGRYQYIEQLGVTIQNVGGLVVRCITVSSHEQALVSLAMLKCTVKAVGGRLELAPFAVVVPYVSEVQEDPLQEDGLPDISVVESMEVA